MHNHRPMDSHHKYHRPRRRHRIDVPRGLLSNIVLRIMKHGPKSGSDIIEEIGEITGWKPSHGSIYPLLDSSVFLLHIPTLPPLRIGKTGRYINFMNIGL